MRGVLVLLWGLTVGAALVQAGGGGSIETALSLAGCLSNSEPTACLKTRGLSILDDWLMSDKEDDDEEDSPADAKEAKAVEEHSDPDSLPPGLPAYLDDLVDRMSDSIVSMMGEGRAANTSLEEARGKKVEKKTKIAMKVILLILFFIGSQLFFMFDKVARTGIFAGLVFILKLWVLLKIVDAKRYIWWLKVHKKEETEYAHHDHHYVEDDYYHYHPGYHQGYAQHPHHYPHEHEHPVESESPWWWARSTQVNHPYRAHIPSNPSQQPLQTQQQQHRQ